MINVGVIFGGVSPEHEVSVISSLQAAAHFDPARYRPVPLYIAKDGAWYTGKCLLDVEAYRDLDRLRNEATPVLLDLVSYGTLDLVETRTAGFGVGKPPRFRIDVAFLGLHGGGGRERWFAGAL